MSSEQETDLESAVLNNDEQLVLSLIEAGANVNEMYSNNNTPLTYASCNGYNTIIHILIQNGADVNLCSNNGTSPLFMASYQGELEVVTQLLNHGANLNNDNGKLVILSSNTQNIVKYNESIENNETEKQNIFNQRIKIMKEFMMRDLIYCKVCDKTYSQLNNNELFACTKCVFSIYCSVDCQRQDWTEHKHECTRLIKN